MPLPARRVGKAGRVTLLRAGATVGALTAAGRILGYGRNVLVAAFLGAGPVADAFFVAVCLPSLARRLFANGGLGAAFIPLFTRRLARNGRPAARGFAGEVLSVAAPALVAFTALLMLAAPWILHAIAPGFESNPQRHGLSVALMRIMLPFVLFGALAQLLAGMLNGFGRFAAAAAMPIVFNLVAIAALLALTPRLHTPAHALAWGIAAAGGFQLACLAAACRRAGILPAPVRPRLTPRVRQLACRAAPAVLGAGAAQGFILVDLALASLLPTGSVSFLHYADRVARLLPSVVGNAAATALLPYLSRRAISEGAPAAASAANRTLEAGLLLSLPGAAALVVIAEPAVAALLQRGAFTAATTAATAAALAAYSAGLPAWIVARTLGSVFFARGDTTTPLGIAAGAVLLNLVLSLLLMGWFGHAGIAMATALAAWAQASVMLGVLLRRGRLALDATFRRRVCAIAAATLVMTGVLWLVRLTLSDQPPAAEGARAASLAILVAAGLAAFAAALLATGALRLRDVARAWRSDPGAS